MSQVISFEDYTPAARYDGMAWSEVQIEESDAYAGPWTLIDTLTISSVDADPENPATRDFTTAKASDADDLWYRLTFYDANGDHGVPSVPVQNVVSTRQVYSTVEELAALLNVPVRDRRVALERCLAAAATEIDSEIGSVDRYGATLPYEVPPALVAAVSLDRAVEHWKQQYSPFGIIGLGDLGATYSARDSWDRHAHKLSPLKFSWGIA